MPNVFFKFKPLQKVETIEGKMTIKAAIHTSSGNSYEVLPNAAAGMGMGVIYREETLCEYNNGEKEETEKSNCISPKFKVGEEVYTEVYTNAGKGIIVDIAQRKNYFLYLVKFNCKLLQLWIKEEDLILVTNKKPAEKPPLGLVPRYIRLAQRKEEIKAAIFRYIEKEKQIKEEWIEEYNEIIELEIKSLTKGGK